MQEDVCTQYTNTMAFSVGMDFGLYTGSKAEGNWAYFQRVNIHLYHTLATLLETAAYTTEGRKETVFLCTSFVFTRWDASMWISAQRGGWLSDLLYILRLAGRVGVHSCYPTSAWQVEAGSYWSISSRRVILHVIESENTLFLHTL